MGRRREALDIEKLVLEHNFVSDIFYYVCMYSMYVLCTIGFLQTV